MKIGYEAKRVFHNTTGLGNYSRDLIRIMRTFYPDNTYYLYNPKPGKVNRLQPDNTLVIERRPRTAFWRFFSSLWRQKAIVNDLEQDNIQLFHGLSGELPLGIEKATIKTVVTIHDLIFMRYPELYSRFDVKMHYKKFKHAAQIADVVVAISEQTKRDIIHYLNIDAIKIQVLYQGCAPIFKEVLAEKYRYEVLKKHQLPNDFILNVGTVEPRKNALNIVKALQDSTENLVVVGKGKDYLKKMKHYITEHHMEQRVFFLEGLQLRELAALYQQAKLFVYPSVFEGFGIPIIEALYSKTPVITSTGSCFAEAGGEASIYVSPDTVPTLKDAIETVLNDTDKQQEMIVKGFEYVQRFNDEVIAENWMNLYQKL